MGEGEREGEKEKQFYGMIFVLVICFPISNYTVLDSGCLNGLYYCYRAMTCEITIRNN